MAQCKLSNNIIVYIDYITIDQYDETRFLLYRNGEEIGYWYRFEINKQDLKIVNKLIKKNMQKYEAIKVNALNWFARADLEIDEIHNIVHGALTVEVNSREHANKCMKKLAEMYLEVREHQNRDCWTIHDENLHYTIIFE